MELDQAAELARRYLVGNGLGYCNVVFFGFHQPNGFTLRNHLALNSVFVRAHDENEVIDLILHEVGHLLEPDDHEHGWKWRAAVQQIDGFHERNVNPQYIEFVRKVEGNAEMKAAVDGYYHDMEKILVARSDRGIMATIDYDSFEHPGRLPAE